ncbi:MAG TPA: Crp/Fnr family transcriptional regulator [Microscillaceae bacterium]|nr:Crp/Fnr family transcriptional regulator [Microscillaceae bacterium]
MDKITEKLAHLNPKFVNEIAQHASTLQVPQDTEILREGQYVKVIPVVLEGLIKVFTRYEDKELLLYYIQPKESCIMSFSANRNNEPSKIFAIAEEDSEILLLPGQKLQEWQQQYTDVHQLFFQQYNLRYAELLSTIQHLLFDKMDKRIYDYLKEKVRLTQKNPIKITHRKIADELGTAREVISRMMKKLENEGKVSQNQEGIKVL